MPRRS